MAEKITTVICQTFLVSGTLENTVTDTVGAGRTVTVNPTDVTSRGTYYRIALVPVSGTGASEALAQHLLAHCETQFGSDWSWAINSDGFVTVTYDGASGTGSITWNTTLRNLLGFSSDISGLAIGATATASYHPLFVFYAISQTSKGWQDIAARSAFAETGESEVYGWKESKRRMRRTSTFRYHPATWAVRASEGAAATPVYPDVKARYLTPSDVPGASLTPPWSLMDFKGTAPGRRCSAIFGEFQGVFTGATTTFDEVMVGLATISRDESTEPSESNWPARFDWRDVVFNLIEPGRSIV